jgi:hypothetical protein
MAMPLGEKLDLPLAWRRVKSDLEARVFVRPPLEVELVEAAEREWIDELKNKIETGYTPHSAVIAEIPKGNGAVRPAALLHLEDRVVYSATVGALLEPIYAGLQWSQGKVDFSYRLSGQARRVDWFTNPFNSWTAFRQSSIQRIEKGAAHAVLTDITGFYENVDCEVLFSDLRQLGCDPEVLRLLQTCLNRWCILPGRGLPQGVSPSDILAKVYMNAIDRRMIDLGLDYIRFVDDMRIFCVDVPTAKRALIELTAFSRRRGLNLQSAKTSILRADDAREEFEGIAVEITAVHKRYRERLIELIGDANPYMPISVLEKNVDARTAPLEVIHETFASNFLEEPRKKFNKSLFRYLLNRLGSQGDEYAVEYCIEQLRERPQETQAILNYCGSVKAYDRLFRGLERFLVSADCIYDYQVYQIYGWINAGGIKPTDPLIAIARKIAFDGSRPTYLRAVCRTILQEYGTPVDLDQLEASYVNHHDDFEKAQVLVSIKRTETGRRNSFYDRVSGDGLLCRSAIKLAKAAKS